MPSSSLTLVDSTLRRRRRGFTLAEALLAATVLAIVGATAMWPFIAGVQQAAEAARLEQAVALGQALMEEILARPFTDPNDKTNVLGPEPGETSRDQFDNIDDFHGLDELTDGLQNFLGNTITASSLVGFRRTATVQYVSFAGLGQQATDTNSFVRIEVRVSENGVPLVRLCRIATREN